MKIYAKKKYSTCLRINGTKRTQQQQQQQQQRKKKRSNQTGETGDNKQLDLFSHIYFVNKVFFSAFFHSHRLFVGEFGRLDVSAHRRFSIVFLVLFVSDVLVVVVVPVVLFSMRNCVWHTHTHTHRIHTERASDRVSWSDGVRSFSLWQLNVDMCVCVCDAVMPTRTVSTAFRVHAY